QALALPVIRPLTQPIAPQPVALAAGPDRTLLALHHAVDTHRQLRRSAGRKLRWPTADVDDAQAELAAYQHLARIPPGALQHSRIAVAGIDRDQPVAFQPGELPGLRQQGPLRVQ